jgi:release factor glutamine methyltransferase
MDSKRNIYKLVRPIVSRTYKPMLQRYLAKPRKYNYNDLSIVVQPGVFHPGFFFSTKLFLEFMKGKELKGKTVLEVGAGSGLISIYAASVGAIVTAIDISKTAVENVKNNATLNGLKVEAFYSDMYSNVAPQKFDIVIVAPPYYKKHPLKEAEHAWYCGENGEYFSKLFSGLREYITPTSKVWMILSDDCDIQMIKAIAVKYGFAMQTVLERTKYWEINYIFEISSNR